MKMDKYYKTLDVIDSADSDATSEQKDDNISDAALLLNIQSSSSAKQGMYLQLVFVLLFIIFKK